MSGYVYFMANVHNTVLYIGVTSNLEKRVWEHKNGAHKDSFAFKYKCRKLVYYEAYGGIKTAIAREKQLKNWKRAWKDSLVAKENPNWRDLAYGLEDCGSSPQ